MAKVTKVVQPAQILHAFTRDVASGRPDGCDLVMAFASVVGKTRLPWSKRLLLKWFGPGQYRGAVKALHGLIGRDSVTLEVDE